jgi:hypothetical protein
MGAVHREARAGAHVRAVKNEADTLLEPLDDLLV